jgi:hypothetical protein
MARVELQSMKANAPSPAIRFCISNRNTYEKLELAVTHRQQTIGFISNRNKNALLAKFSVRFRTPHLSSTARRSPVPFAFGCSSLACRERSRRVSCHSSLRFAPMRQNRPKHHLTHRRLTIASGAGHLGPSQAMSTRWRAACTSAAPPNAFSAAAQHVSEPLVPRLRSAVSILHFRCFRRTFSATSLVARASYEVEGCSTGRRP